MTITTSTPHILIVDDDVALLQALPQALHIRLNNVVIDTSDSALPYIFEQFYRAPDIDVQSVPGTGSVFSIVLPVYIKSHLEQTEQAETGAYETQQSEKTPLMPHTQAVWTVTPVH